MTGDREIDRKLANLKQSAQNKIARPALTKGVRLSVKAMKAAVPSHLKDAKRAIGFKVKVKGTDQIVAKAGAGVGIKASTLAAFREKQKSRRGGRPGIGISAVNIHWFILGTAQRTTGTSRTGSHKKNAIAARKFTGNPVHSTGQMRPQMDPIKEGYLRTEQLATQAIIMAARSLIAIQMRN